MRAQRLPKLDTLMQRERRAGQSWEAQREIARMWNVALGGTIEKR